MIGVVREIVKKFTRSSGWRKARALHIKKHKVCAVCGKKHLLQVHHKKDFSHYPELELDPDNLITFCGRCHLFVGHLGYWKTNNGLVEEDAILWRFRFETRVLYSNDTEINLSEEAMEALKNIVKGLISGGCTFEAYQSRNKKWRWRLKAKNNKIIASSGEDFSSKQACLKAIKTAKVSTLRASIVIK